MRPTLLLATHNSGKVREIQRMLLGSAVRVQSLRDHPEVGEAVEDGRTLEQNAGKKARLALRRTGLLSVADDTGLFVDALQGKPGVRSARYAGPDCDPVKNNRKLLAALSGVPRSRRGATFACVIAIARPGRGIRFVRGTLRGRITETLRGKHGWGYDPIFEVPSLGRTFAEMTAAQKNAVSHRGRAMRKAQRVLRKILKGSR